MSVRVGRQGTGTDRPVLAVAVAAVVVAAVGMLVLVRAAVGDRPAYRTVRVDQRAALPVQVDAVDRGGGRMGLGEAGPRATTTFSEVADLGSSWTLVATYGGREVWRQTITGEELARRGWTIEVPAAATARLERQGFE
jgi:hypothetical protein